MNVSAAVKAMLSFTPEKSQIFVVISSLISLACFSVSFAFLWAEKERWEVPLICGSLILLVSFIAWAISHRGAELAGGESTEIRLTSTELYLKTDTRNEVDKSILQGISEHISVIVNRQPLPVPAGKIGVDGSVIAGSEDLAKLEVERLNKLASEQLAKVGEVFGVSTRSHAQSSDYVDPPAYTGVTGPDPVA